MGGTYTPVRHLYKPANNEVGYGALVDANFDNLDDAAHQTDVTTLQAQVAALIAAPSGTAGGDLSGSYPNPTVAKVNGGAVPVSKTIVGTDGSGHIVDATSATLTNNTSGTAAGLSGTPALPNGTTATTQSAFDGTTKVATDAYVDSQSAVSNVASKDYYILPWGECAFSASTTTQAFPNTSQFVRLYQFNLSRTVTFTRMSVVFGAGSAGQHAYIGIYNVGVGTAAGSLIVQGTFNYASGIVTVTLGPITLKPGTYWLAYTSDSTTVQLSANACAGGAATFFQSGSIFRFCFCQSAASSGVLPATTGNSQNIGFNSNNQPPLVFLEP